MESRKFPKELPAAILLTLISKLVMNKRFHSFLFFFFEKKRKIGHFVYNFLVFFWFNSIRFVSFFNGFFLHFLSIRNFSHIISLYLVNPRTE